MSKLEMILQVVDWEHRYKLGRLMGGQWCLERIRILSKHSRAHMADVFDFTFNVRPEAIKKEKHVE